MLSTYYLINLVKHFVNQDIIIQSIPVTNPVVFKIILEFVIQKEDIIITIIEIDIQAISKKSFFITNNTNLIHIHLE